MNDKFNHLILLTGTNPLPNFVVADYFLKHNENIQKIWLIYSKAVESFQAGTYSQAKNLESLLQEIWKGKCNLQFPFETLISLSDVSSAAQIERDIPAGMIEELKNSEGFHLNYTGGTKAMSTHVYRVLEKKVEKSSFSYLDARKFRLVDDNKGVIADDLREIVSISLEELIVLHGFQKHEEDKWRKPDFDRASEIIQDCIKNGSFKGVDGHIIEDYLAGKIEKKLKNKFNSDKPVLQNWQIKKRNWETHFELDVVLLHGYHLTGISCKNSNKKQECKYAGFEIIHRIRQIGGDEAKTVLITGLKSIKAGTVQDELFYETGWTKENTLVLGVDDFKNDKFIAKIEEFIFGD